MAICRADLEKVCGKMKVLIVFCVVGIKKGGPQYTAGCKVSGNRGGSCDVDLSNCYLSSRYSKEEWMFSKRSTSVVKETTTKGWRTFAC